MAIIQVEPCQPRTQPLDAPNPGPVPAESDWSPPDSWLCATNKVPEPVGTVQNVTNTDDAHSQTSAPADQQTVGTTTGTVSLFSWIRQLICMPGPKDSSVVADNN
ncbi:unnamed protein product [Caenorhabditis sp. 36 PRJEB53466]|nr:unnamed protein product [Caenorhabditis sp. 36 PRJEB53466]